MGLRTVANHIKCTCIQERETDRQTDRVAAAYIDHNKKGGTDIANRNVL